MYVKKLHLEVTRNCTLACEHCLRGDSEHVNMGLDTLDNVFRDIDRIDFLLLTGGEPLIAIQQLERLVEILKTGKVIVYNIGFVTNGTVLSERILKVLKELNDLSTLRISISGDIFHKLEIERLGFKEKVYNNSSTLFSLFNANDYVREYGEVRFVTYDAIGRAKKLTPERLAEINRIANNIYRISAQYIDNSQPYVISDNEIIGTLTIDVHGNIVTGSRSFEDEDAEAKKKHFNINEMSLMSAAEGFINYKDKDDSFDTKTLAKKYW